MRWLTVMVSHYFKKNNNLLNIPDDFKGKMLDVPVGTAVFTTEKYKRMKQAIHSTTCSV